MSILTFLALILLIVFAVLLFIKNKLTPKRLKTTTVISSMPSVTAEEEMRAHAQRVAEKQETQSARTVKETTVTHINHDASHIENLPIEIKEESR